MPGAADTVPCFRCGKAVATVRSTGVCASCMADETVHPRCAGCGKAVVREAQTQGQAQQQQQQQQQHPVADGSVQQLPMPMDGSTNRSSRDTSGSEEEVQSSSAVEHKSASGGAYRRPSTLSIDAAAVLADDGDVTVGYFHWHRRCFVAFHPKRAHSTDQGLLHAMMAGSLSPDAKFTASAAGAASAMIAQSPAGLLHSSIMAATASEAPATSSYVFYSTSPPVGDGAPGLSAALHVSVSTALNVYGEEDRKSQPTPDPSRALGMLSDEFDNESDAASCSSIDSDQDMDTVLPRRCRRPRFGVGANRRIRIARPTPVPAGGSGGGKTHRPSPRRASFYSSDLQQLVRRIQVMGLLQERTYLFKTYPNCLVGRELVDYLVISGQASTRGAAVALGRRLEASNMLRHVVGEHHFEDEYLFYNLFPTGADNPRPTVVPPMPISSGSRVSSAASTTSMAPSAITSAPQPLTPAAIAEIDALDDSDDSPAQAPPTPRRPRSVELLNTTLKEGWLIKQGHTVKNWRRRWFILKGYELKYYNDPTSTSPKGCIDVRNYRATRGMVARSPLCIHLVCVKDAASDYYLIAENENMLQSWLTTFQQCIEAWKTIGAVESAGAK